MNFNVSDTMKVSGEKEVDAQYIVIKIGDKTFSTSYGEIRTGRDINVSKVQDVTTTGVGKQDNFWIKGTFTEGINHQKIVPVGFELNIYAEQGDLKTNSIKAGFNPKEWAQDKCEVCEGHLYCENCKKYTWHKEVNI